MSQPSRRSYPRSSPPNSLPKLRHRLTYWRHVRRAVKRGDSVEHDPAGFRYRVGALLVPVRMLTLDQCDRLDAMVAPEVYLPYPEAQIADDSENGERP
jgi:hypothetical protein